MLQGVNYLLVLDLGEFQSRRLRGLKGLQSPLMLRNAGIQLGFEGFNSLILVGSGGFQLALKLRKLRGMIASRRVEGVPSRLLFSLQRPGVISSACSSCSFRVPVELSRDEFMLLTEVRNGVVPFLEGIREFAD
jgi:hypothetical protein